MKNNYSNNPKQIIAVSTAFAVITISTLIYWAIDSRKQDRKYLDVEFSGQVERIDYDIKQFPTIQIHNVSYSIDAGYYTDHQIEVGDSVIKVRGSYVYKLIKHKTKKEIEFTIDPQRF